MKLSWMVDSFLFYALLGPILFSPGVGLAGDGNDVGNGGHGVVCADANGAITSVQFFDLWYAAKEVKLDLVQSVQDPVSLGRTIVALLFQADRNYFESLLVSYANVSRAQVQLGNDLKLVPPQAFLGNIVPAPDTGCEILPLAVYADSGVLLTQEKLWNFLTTGKKPVTANVAVAAFYVHEALGDMLRARKLAELKGQPMTADQRREIARETVSLTALAFTKFSQKQLSRRLRRYFTTGQIFEKPKLERLEIEHLVWGEMSYDLETARVSAKPKYADWKRAEEPRLAPLCDFLFVEDGGNGVGNAKDPRLPQQAWWGYQSGKLTLVPSRAVKRFTDTVYSLSVPPDTDPLWIHPFALQSYLQRAKNWRTVQKARLANGLFLLNEGSKVEYQNNARAWFWHWRSIWDAHAGLVGIDPEKYDSFGASGVHYDYHQLGEFAYSTGEVYVYVNDVDLRNETELIRSTPYQFYAPSNEGIEIEAARLSLKDFDERACPAWLDKSYRAGAVFASCVPQGPPRNTVDVHQSLSSWESWGVAYFEDK